MQVRHVQSLAKPRARDVHIFDPVFDPDCLQHRVIVAIYPRLILLHLYPTPWLNILVSLGVESGPIPDSPTKASRMNEVKAFIG